MDTIFFKWEFTPYTTQNDMKKIKQGKLIINVQKMANFQVSIKKYKG